MERSSRERTARLANLLVLPGEEMRSVIYHDSVAHRRDLQNRVIAHSRDGQLRKNLSLSTCIWAYPSFGTSVRPRGAQVPLDQSKL